MHLHPGLASARMHQPPPGGQLPGLNDRGAGDHKPPFVAFVCPRISLARCVEFVEPISAADLQLVANQQSAAAAGEADVDGVAAAAGSPAAVHPNFGHKHTARQVCARLDVVPLQQGQQCVGLAH